jgi:oligoribonuclease (3'-5' exoribonuclease)
MKYCVIDLESTGVNPEIHQIIEFAAVIDDLKDQKPLDLLPKFQTYILHDNYVGESHALAMHTNIFKKLANWQKIDVRVCRPENLFKVFHTFLILHGYEVDQSNMIKVNAAGKNFAAFDKRFLDKLPNDHVIFRHRTLDPAILYLDPFDDVIPDTKECYLRAGMSDEVAHTALDDALGVVKLLRRRFCDGISLAKIK